MKCLLLSGALPPATPHIYIYMRVCVLLYQRLFATLTQPHTSYQLNPVLFSEAPVSISTFMTHRVSPLFTNEGLRSTCAILCPHRTPQSQSFGCFPNKVPPLYLKNASETNAAPSLPACLYVYEMGIRFPSTTSPLRGQLCCATYFVRMQCAESNILAPHGTCR